jgi:hypothetical protein
VILLIGHRLHPFIVLTVEQFCKRRVRHCRGHSCSVPVSFAARARYDATGAGFRPGAAFALGSANAVGNDQCLPKRVRMPVGARAGLECHDPAAGTCWFLSLEEAVDTADSRYTDFAPSEHQGTDSASSD